MEKYDNLEKENIRLRSTNKLLTETAENAALLKEKVKQLENDRKRVEAKCQQMNEITKCLIRDIHSKLILVIREHL